MPDMAFLMLQQCTIDIGDEGTNLNKKVYSYEFLEDAYFIRSWRKGKKNIRIFQSEFETPIIARIKIKIEITNKKTKKIYFCGNKVNNNSRKKTEHQDRAYNILCNCLQRTMKIYRDFNQMFLR
jgi:hypothetical protein